ncbi:hypothetical protein HYFRA_00006480 [Hymenoscyphus fraxineus]|uniref:Heterokaryon incompatibility domain-containing protein n=1 Tax=Hymenoscyphus fraxineus TaxID=746836 RepID=A0A9N9PR31_9HELO|nr:hypothetical protein HYFRA_00006480 [Hymenoscyphus fraxineus]
MSMQGSSDQVKAGAESAHILLGAESPSRDALESDQTKVLPVSKKTISKLCMICTKLLQDYELGSGDNINKRTLFIQGPNVAVPHHPSIVSLEKAVAAGCVLCHRLLTTAAESITLARDKDPDFPHLGFVFSIKHLWWMRGEGMQMRWHPHNPTIFAQSKALYDGQLAELHLYEANTKINTPMEAFTDSETTFKQIHGWYHQCRNTHGCQSLRGTPLPSRLLYIKNNCLGLCETSTFPLNWLNKRPQYAALSHCWGDKDFFKLSQSNLPEVLEEIPLQHLTKTFRDAITITQRLGLSFLWIDSLCIIQDSVDDWQKEAGLMADVYGGAAVTIAASDAKDGSVGCFFQRSPKDIQSLRLETETNVYTVAEHMSQSSGVRDNVLAKRAWAFQEGLLSTRVLYFTRAQVFWQCKSIGLANEVYPKEIPSIEVTCVERLWRSSDLRSWLDIVTRYSATDLTYTTDKLIALSGVAKDYQRRHKLNNEDYIAGIWKHKEPHLWHGLLWKIDGLKKTTQPSQYQAPTWSWASQNNPVTFPIGSIIKLSSPYVSFVSQHLTHPNQGTHGEVSSGYIRLRSTNLLIARWVQEGANDFFISLNTEAMNFRIAWDHEPNIKLDMYLLPILEYDSPPENNTDPPRLYRIRLQGIVLQNYSGKAGTFRRTGYFDLMLSRRQIAASPKLDCAMAPIIKTKQPKEDLWKVVTRHFEDLEKVSEPRGYYIPEDEIYESSSTNEEDGERVHEIIII